MAGLHQRDAVDWIQAVFTFVALGAAAIFSLWGVFREKETSAQSAYVSKYELAGLKETLTQKIDASDAKIAAHDAALKEIATSLQSINAKMGELQVSSAGISSDLKNITENVKRLQDHR